MKNYDKYSPGYFPAAVQNPEWVKKDHIEKAPVWCSSDLRDGNQSLIVPMSLEQKLEFFDFLTKTGFKEIEVGFPAASETEFELIRTLINENRVPDDVSLQVLTQAREHIIRKTFEALKGAKKAIVHFYNSTSLAQREQVFKKSKEEIKEIATNAAKLVKQLADEYESENGGSFLFEYSPESFTGTEPEYALEVVNAVLDELQPTAKKPVIINLPVTVEMSLPHVYATQIEYMSKNMKYREHVVLSVHPHNDRGTGVACAELALLAGADRVEGTLFGNGERTGNVDIVTLAMNMFSHGVNPNLNFENMPAVVEAYEKATGMHVYDRQPYAGALVFAAFSGSHQDAIAKGMNFRKDNKLHRWSVPYLPIDPADVGRVYETDVIRINSQSGKGGIGYILEEKFGYSLPPKMREHFGYAVKNVSDKEHKELSPMQIKNIFEESYLNVSSPLNVTEVHFIQKNGILADISVYQNGENKDYHAKGNGRLDAVSNALKAATGKEFSILTYAEHALDTGSSGKAVAYVGLEWEDKSVSWGAGQNTDIIVASVNALISAYNNKQ